MTAANLFLMLGLIAALGYWPLVQAAPTTLRSALKAASLALVGIGLALNGAGPLPLLALALSVFGDFALSREGDRWFLAGLSAFLLAHVVYAALFWGHFDPAALRWGMVAAIVLLAVSIPVWLLPSTGDMRGPVVAYVLTISVMGLLAAGLPSGAALIVWGAALFIASDAVLSLALFVAPHRAILHFTVWPLYVAGQVLIQFGFLSL